MDIDEFNRLRSDLAYIREYLDQIDRHVIAACDPNRESPNYLEDSWIKSQAKRMAELANKVASTICR